MCNRWGTDCPCFQRINRKDKVMKRSSIFGVALLVMSLFSSGCVAGGYTVHATYRTWEPAPVYCPPPPPPVCERVYCPPPPPVCERVYCPPPPPPFCERVVVVTPPPCRREVVHVYHAPRMAAVWCHVRGRHVRINVTVTWHEQHNCYGFVDEDGCFTRCN